MSALLYTVVHENITGVTFHGHVWLADEKA